MKRTLLAIGLALVLGASVEAKTPKEVLEPYKAYRAALAANQNDDAAEFAYEAWQLAEDLMGESKTTGDLAANFAELNPRYLDEKASWKHVMKAHKRSIDLSNLYDDDPAGVEVDRRTKYLSWLISHIPKKAKVGWERKYGAKKLNERIAELGMSGSTFDAESMAFNAQIAMLNQHWETTEVHSKEAMALFDARTDGVFSIYEYAVPIYLARAYAETDRDVDAALTYQAMIEKLEVAGGHDNKISGESYAEWLRLRDKVISEKNPDPRAQQVIDFTVPAGRTEALLPLVRQPPKFPSGFLRGSQSGYVKLIIEVDKDGYVINPVIAASTKKSLHDPTLEALKGWRYTPNLPEAERKGLEVKVGFDLRNRSGKLFPAGPEKPRL